MTPKDRAIRALRAIDAEYAMDEVIVSTIADEIRQASTEGVELERERIAKLAEKWADELQYNPAGLPETARRLREFAHAIRCEPKP